MEKEERKRRKEASKHVDRNGVAGSRAQGWTGRLFGLNEVKRVLARSACRSKGVTSKTTSEKEAEGRLKDAVNSH
jgi:hypothetical protein